MLGVIFGGIVLFLLYGWIHNHQSRSAKRLLEYWETYLSPLDVVFYFGAEEYLETKYGDKYLEGLSVWTRNHGLVVPPEQRIAKLMELGKIADEKKDNDTGQHFVVLRHLAVRQWATEVGLQGRFDLWEKECLSKISQTQTRAFKHDY